jgi:hypothetical protein
MFVVIIDQADQLLRDHNLKNNPRVLLDLLAPCREDVVVA